MLVCVCANAQTSDSVIVNKLKERGVSFSHNNSVTLLATGREKFEDMFQAIRNARHSIHLEYFNFRNDSMRRPNTVLRSERFSTLLAILPTTVHSSSAIWTPYAPKV